MVNAPGLLCSVVVEPVLIVGPEVFPGCARGVDDSSHLGNSVKLVHEALPESYETNNLLTKQPFEGINMHMIVSHQVYLSVSTLPANHARGGFDACMCMCACMENLNLRDTF
jgi:hypothetical protein